MTKPDIRALLFDVFGTVVDWRASIVGEGLAMNRRLGIDRDLDPDALVVAQAEQVVDDLEALLPLRVVDPADVDQHLEQAMGIVSEPGQRAFHLPRRHRQHEPVAMMRDIGAVDRQGRTDVFAEFDKRWVHPVP